MATIEILILLAKKGANRHAIRVSTTSIGQELRMSQQNASRILIDLEKLGEITRTAGGIYITKKGMEELKHLQDALGAALNGKTITNELNDEVVKVTGTVTGGMGEGAYYVKQYSGRIKKALGFVPFPGTLNIRINGKPPIERARFVESAPITIEGFESEGRKFGRIIAYPCRIGNENCFVVIPERTHHCDKILEVISKKELRRKFPEGKKVSVRIKIG